MFACRPQNQELSGVNRNFLYRRNFTTFRKPCNLDIYRDVNASCASLAIGWVPIDDSAQSLCIHRVMSSHSSRLCRLVAAATLEGPKNQITTTDDDSRQRVRRALDFANFVRFEFAPSDTISLFHNLIPFTPARSLLSSIAGCQSNAHAIPLRV